MGGSVAGLLSAAAVSGHYDEVRLIEPDTPDGSYEPRKGAPQGRILARVLRPLPSDPGAIPWEEAT